MIMKSLIKNYKLSILNNENISRRNRKDAGGDEKLSSLPVLCIKFCSNFDGQVGNLKYPTTRPY